MAKIQHFYKSHRSQRIADDPKWTNLMFVIGGVRRRRFYCDADGVLTSRLYLPVEFTLNDGQPATIRARLVRDTYKGKPIDPTAYDERTLVASSDGFARLSFPYAGKAQRGRRYYWQAQVLGDATVNATGTHYADFWRR